jgi:hypothetical protein
MDFKKDDKGNVLCYFSLEVRSIVDVYRSSEKEPERHVKIRLYFDEERYSDDFVIPLLQLEKFNWLAKNERCRFNPKISEIKVKRYLADEIRANLPEAPVEKQYILDSLGCHVIEGVRVFNTGEGLIWPSPIKENWPDIKPVTSPFHLDIDATLKEDEALAGMLKLISLCPNAGRIILAHTLLYIMRSAYVDVGKSPCVSVFLHGESNLKKTSLSALMTQLHNLGSGIESPPRLNSSISAAIKIIFGKSDCVVVLDDLFPADSKQIRHKQEEVLSEITRIIGDGVEPARMRGGKLAKTPPTCGVLFTGEYLIGTGSTAARLLPVEMTPPDQESLRKFQTQPLIVSTFFRFFIEWFISNYDWIRDQLNKWANAYLKTRIVAHDRLNETHFFLNTAYVMLMQYCYVKGFLSQEEVKRIHHFFGVLLRDLVREQQERVTKGTLGKAKDFDCLSRIRSLYQATEFHLAENAEEFKSGEYDGVIHNGCLCLRGATLRKFFPAYSRLGEIGDVLLAQGALEPGTKKKTKQIFAAGGKHFYFIPLRKIQ